MPSSLKETLATILVVDDHEGVLKIVVSVLNRAKFRVLSATSGPGAIKLAEETDEKIDLLLSDVEMPGMSGPDLGEAMKKARPDIHIMLMSAGANGHLHNGWPYIQKPFMSVNLVEMITNVVHSSNRSQPDGQKCKSSGEPARKVLRSFQAAGNGSELRPANRLAIDWSARSLNKAPNKAPALTMEPPLNDAAIPQPGTCQKCHSTQIQLKRPDRREKLDQSHYFHCESCGFISFTESQWRRTA